MNKKHVISVPGPEKRDGIGAIGLADYLASKKDEIRQNDFCMALIVNDTGQSVELYLDTSIDTYSEHIEGEGGDIGLMRCMKTNKVVGCRLPLMNGKLAVRHDGPIRINAAFRKSDAS